MSVFSGIPLDKLGEGNLLVLIANRTCEARDLEFKQAVVGGSDADRREFLKDVTALANSVGGHLVIGMAETDGVASALAGLTTRPATEEILRLENMLLASVEPRLFGVRFKEVLLTEGGYALIISVPQSWNPPHRVTHNGVNRYYLRHSSGAYEPSVDQLRAVFLGGLDAERCLHEFRLERLARLMTGERGFKLSGRGHLVIHTVPLAAGESGFVMPNAQSVFDFLPPWTSSSSHRYNLEGLLFHSVAGAGEGATKGYTQVFRDGRVEMARGGLVHESPREDGNLPISAAVLVRDMVAGVAKCLVGSSKYGAAFPMAVMISVLNARGTCLRTFGDECDGNILDRSDLLFTPVTFAEWGGSEQLQKTLLPVLDALWNAYGNEQCSVVRDVSGDWSGLPVAWLR